MGTKRINGWQCFISTVYLKAHSLKNKTIKILVFKNVKLTKGSLHEKGGSQQISCWTLIKSFFSSTVSLEILLIPGFWTLVPIVLFFKKLQLFSKYQERCRSGRTGLTRNQVSVIGGPGVRIPLSPPSLAEAATRGRSEGELRSMIEVNNNLLGASYGGHGPPNYDLTLQNLNYSFARRSLGEGELRIIKWD